MTFVRPAVMCRVQFPAKSIVMSADREEWPGADGSSRKEPVIVAGISVPGKKPVAVTW